MKQRAAARRQSSILGWDNGTGEPPFSQLTRWAISDALDGDPALLSRLLSSASETMVQAAGVLEKRMRLRKSFADQVLARQLRSASVKVAFAGDLLGKKIKPRRPKKGEPTRRTNDDIASVVLYLEACHPDWQRSKTIIPDVAKAFKVSEKHVYKVLAKSINDSVEFPAAHFVESILARK